MKLESNIKKIFLIICIILAVMISLLIMLYLKIACVYSTVSLIDASSSNINGYVYFYSDTMDYFVNYIEDDSEKLLGKVDYRNRIIVKEGTGEHEYMIRYTVREDLRKYPAELVKKELKIVVNVNEGLVTPVDLYGYEQDRQLKVECRIDEPITIEEWQRRADAWAERSQENIREVELMKPECPWDCKKVPRLVK